MKAFLSAVVALVLVSTAAAQPPGKPGGRPSFDRLLTAFDANGDGKLSKDEVPPRVWMRLGRADANDDGTVTRDEFDSFPAGR